MRRSYVECIVLTSVGEFIHVGLDMYDECDLRYIIVIYGLKK